MAHPQYYNTNQKKNDANGTYFKRKVKYSMMFLSDSKKTLTQV